MKAVLILFVLFTALFAQTQLRLEGQPQKSATELVAVQDVNGCIEIASGSQILKARLEILIQKRELKGRLLKRHSLSGKIAF